MDERVKRASALNQRLLMQKLASEEEDGMLVEVSSLNTDKLKPIGVKCSIPFEESLKMMSFAPHENPKLKRSKTMPECAVQTEVKLKHKKGLEYIDNMYSTNFSITLQPIAAIRLMASDNIILEEDFFTKTGGNYKDLEDEYQKISDDISNLQKRLSQLHDEMGKNIPKFNELKLDGNTLWDDILAEMKDFQDLVSYEHREKRKKFKNVITSTQKQSVKSESIKLKQVQENNKSLIQTCRNIASIVDIFWKKIERFAWERLKRDLQAQLLEKKRMRLDKFIEDAIKLSATHSERRIINRKLAEIKERSCVGEGSTDSITTEGTDLEGDDTAHTDGSQPSPASLEDEYVMDDDTMKRMEDDDLHLDEEMDTDDEEDKKGILSQLEDDANLPIEEILKRYQMEGNMSEESEEEKEEEEMQSLKTPIKIQPDNTSSSTSPPSPASLEDEYVMDDDTMKRMEDDDLHLDEEMDTDDEEDKKGILSQLEDDANLPIEEILKRYQMEGNMSEESEEEEEEEEIKEENSVRVSKGVSSPARLQDKPFRVPSLIRANLRPYQFEGLKWLSGLYERGVNGILADEMGLGKTLQAICLLAHLACEYNNWGPHLIVVPTSVLLNWVMEFKKFCPGFKILAYYGTQPERAKKRMGWNKPYAFNVCISSYATVVQDAFVMKRKSWVYMILDEAQNIKNFNSKRWQTLLTFNTEGRLLLTGTPLQNSLQELWSLMHFILPEIFSSHSEFKEWFSDPLTEAIEQEQVNLESVATKGCPSDLVAKLHTVFRPYLLRRLKKDVEKQMPSKYEHVIKCHLTRRQRVLYDEFMSSRSAVDALNNPNYRGMLNVLMQLRKICNHPDQLQSRPVESPFIDLHFLDDIVLPAKFLIGQADLRLYKDEVIGENNFSCKYWENRRYSRVPLSYEAYESIDALKYGKFYASCSSLYEREVYSLPVFKNIHISKAPRFHKNTDIQWPHILIHELYKCRKYRKTQQIRYLDHQAPNGVHSDPTNSPLYITEGGNSSYRSDVGNTSSNLTPESVSGPNSENINLIKEEPGCKDKVESANNAVNVTRREFLEIGSYDFFKIVDRADVSVTTVGDERNLITDGFLSSSTVWSNLVSPTVNGVVNEYWWMISAFTCILNNKIQCMPRRIYYSGGILQNQRDDFILDRVKTEFYHKEEADYFKDSKNTIEHVYGLQKLLFPPRRLLNDDCGKFLVLGNLLKKLKNEGHRCLLYTQFSKMLDILENWINYLGLTYLRLDGSTKVDMRQRIVTRFNENAKIFLFISSTRAGGVGLTLTGADTVIFYDTDWNPAMDRQAMDRCHRIGQTREVNVYRLISEHTVEENIWRKQLQKRRLDDIVVDKGNFNTDENWFSNVDTLLNILKERNVDNTDIYGKKVLHEAESEVAGKKFQALKLLIEAEDVDDSLALKHMARECEDINQEFRMDFKSDLISSIPALVTYCIKHLLKYQTPALIARVEDMKIRIQAEEFDPDERESLEDSDVDRSDQDEFTEEEEDDEENDE